MAQRGGSVTSHFRFGDKVWSPLVPVGTADLLMAFEALEGLRYVHWLKPEGVLVYNALRINPSPVSAGLATYPEDIDALIRAAWPTAKCVNANELATKAGTVKAANVAMLGAMSPTLPFRRDDDQRRYFAALDEVGGGGEQAVSLPLVAVSAEPVQDVEHRIAALLA